MKRSERISPHVSDENAATDDDVRVAIDALTAAELRRIRQFAAWRIRPLGRAAQGRNADDLLQEAIASTCVGDRCWNKNSVDFVGHLKGVIRSMSSHWRDKVHSHSTFLESEDESESQVSSPVQHFPSPDPNPEQALLIKEAVEQIEAAVSKNPLASLILDGRREGMKRVEIIEALGVSQQEFDTADKWLRRNVRKFVKGM